MSIQVKAWLICLGNEIVKVLTKWKFLILILIQNRMALWAILALIKMVLKTYEFNYKFNELK